MMNRESFQAAVEQFKRRSPFRPFLVELDDGKKVIVQKPEELHCLRGLGAHCRSSDGEFTLVDYDIVSRVADLTPSQS